MAPTPITIVTGFLGSGKTTLILNLIPQLPKSYKLALLKNEFGDLAIDSQLAASKSISGVRELLNGCICCNLVGQVGDALETLRAEQNPDRIVIETSGSAFPATIALEINRLAREANDENFVLDGVISVIDVENWNGYEETGKAAEVQAKFTDFVVFNKWELVNERRFDWCLDRLRDIELEVQTPFVKSNKGVVDKDIIIGIDGAVARSLQHDPGQEHSHDHYTDHESEVEVLSVTVELASSNRQGIDVAKLDTLLRQAPKDEIYRIKAILLAGSKPRSSEESPTTAPSCSEPLSQYILNWAFGRWTFTSIENTEINHALRMTVICAKYESTKWKKRLEELDFGEGKTIVERVA